MEGLQRVRILGVPVHRVSMTTAVTEADRLAASGGGPHLVGLCNTYTAVVAQEDAALRRFYESAALNLPDGMPLVLVSRLYGHRIPERVCGPDFTVAFLRQTEDRYRHFFLGARPGVAEEMVQKLRTVAPRMVVAGTLAPPFGDFSEADNARMIDTVNSARTDVLWVGLTAPKQEKWLLQNAGRLDVRLGVGIGAAFDLLAGRVRRAPRLVRNFGFEWAFRLSMEPRRLWRRYTVGNGRFCTGVFREFMRGGHRQEQPEASAAAMDDRRYSPIS